MVPVRQILETLNEMQVISLVVSYTLKLRFYLISFNEVTESDQIRYFSINEKK